MNCVVFKRPHKDPCSVVDLIFGKGYQNCKKNLSSEYHLPLLLNVDLKVPNYGNKLSFTVNKTIRSFRL